MTIVNRNIIRKQTVNFQYNGNTDAFALQKEVSDWCKFSLIPEIEQQLELFGLADNFITIDKLSIDAVIDKKDWQQKIRNELILELSQKLRDHKPAAKKITDQQKEDRSYKLDELILFYFEKGYLPWWSKALVENNFSDVLLNWIDEEKSTERAEAITLKFQQINSAPVIQRISNQLPGQLFFKFLKHIFKKETATVTDAESFFNEILKAGDTKAKGKIGETIFKEIILAMLVKNKGKIDVELSVQVFRAAILSKTIVVGNVSKILQPGKSLSDNPFVKAWHKISAQEVKIATDKKTIEQIPGNKKQYWRIIDELTNKTLTTNTAEQVAEDLREGIYIENAGAVIIAAFLPRLFDRLKITNATEIVKPDLAALMIQYLVSGNTRTEEHELLLPKILCGISPELPVNTTKKLTTAQQAEADEMLGAVIQHWSVIGGTSVEGLRESFLKRSGKLIWVEEEWLLQVEQKAYDMLLQQLPWNISMIKLPWMTSILKTEWV